MLRLNQVLFRKLATSLVGCLCMKIIPIKDQVLVRQDPKKDKVGSLFVPQGSEDYPNYGTVEAVGPGAVVNGRRVEPSVKAGDRVLFKRKASSSLFPDARDGQSELRDFLMLREEDILAIVEEV
jgi:chaperonin GroES